MKRKSLFGVVVLLVLVGLLLTSCGAAKKTLTIGLLPEVAAVHGPAIDGFKAAMTDLGYVEGDNTVYIRGEIQESTVEKIDAEIKDLLAQGVDLLVVAGNLAATRAKEATAGTDIPVVFAGVTDPVGGGLVESITHPGGNITGVQVGVEIPKALEWLLQIVPDAKRVYVPYNPSDEVSVAILGGLEGFATQLGIEFVRGEVGSAEEAAAAIESLPADIDAIFRLPSPTLDPQNSVLSQAAIKRGLPMVASLPLDEAVLLTLASPMSVTGEQAARLANQILKGTKPGDLPVEVSEYFLTINLKTAQAIGLDIPDAILQQADTIVR